MVGPWISLVRNKRFAHMSKSMSWKVCYSYSFTLQRSGSLNFWLTDCSPDNVRAFTPSLVSTWGTSPPHRPGQDYWRTLPEGTCHCRNTLTDPALLQPFLLDALRKNTWKKALSHSLVSIQMPENLLLCSLSLYPMRTYFTPPICLFCYFHLQPQFLPWSQSFPHLDIAQGVQSFDTQIKTHT